MFIKRIKLLDGLKPKREFTEPAREFAKAHLAEVELFWEDRPRYQCALLAVLYEELQDRPDLQELVLEATWMGFRMDAALRRNKGENVFRPPE